MTNSTTKPVRRRRMARAPMTEAVAVGDDTGPNPASSTVTADKPPSRLDQLEQLLQRKEGASIAEMVEATGWQQHSVRGAMAGALKKKRGLAITSEKLDGLRRYRAEKPA